MPKQNMDGDNSESELAKLLRQFRIMEGDRQAYSLQSLEQIRKQQLEIDKLLKEQGELHRDFSVCLSHEQQDGGDTKVLQALLERRDGLEEEQRKERQSQTDLQREISDMEMKLSGQRRSEVSTRDTQRSEGEKTQRAIHTLEYKLDRALTQFNEQLAKNTQLREELQTLCIERDRFQQLRERLDKELQDVRKKTGEMIDLSRAAYDSRVEAQSKMGMMREKAVKDLSQFNAELKELERVMEHEQTLKEFMSVKCNERSGRENFHEMGRRHMSEVREQQTMDSEEESLEAMREVFERIETLTGEENLDMLVTRFIQGEDRNFALFNVVNGQNNEAEALRDQIQQIQEEMKNLKERDLQQEHDHRSLLREFDEQQKEAEAQTDECENQESVISNILEKSKTGVGSIFSKMDCDQSVIDDILGSSPTISDNNIMSYLVLVEQKTNELLTLRAYLNSKDPEQDYNPKDLAKFLLGQDPELLPDLGDEPAVDSVELELEDSSATDEDERPLSQGELRRRIMGMSVSRQTGKGSRIISQTEDE